ncbi:hypothetical protein L828_3583 [Mycobacteroides abscessus MAB_030201_1061]|nr:hypothetical protein L828_3583 [Mycobacteroides abscessus MAB_030201_1061]
MPALPGARALGVPTHTGDVDSLEELVRVTAGSSVVSTSW